MLTLTIGMPGSPYPMNYIERLIAIFVAWSSVLLIGVLVTNICEVLDPPPPTEFQLTVARRVERFDRRGTEPFEPFEPFEFFQNRIFFLENSKISENFNIF